MNEEKLEARRIVVVDKINQIKQELAPVASKILAFRALGFIAGVFWSWKTNQKFWVKPLAGFAGGYLADILSNLFLSNSSGAKTAELMQLNGELDQIDSQLRKKNFKENIEREIKSI